MKNKVLSLSCKDVFLVHYYPVDPLLGMGLLAERPNKRRLYPPTFFFIIYPPIDLPKIQNCLILMKRTYYSRFFFVVFAFDNSDKYCLVTILSSQYCLNLLITFLLPLGFLVTEVSKTLVDRSVCWVLFNKVAI